MKKFGLRLTGRQKCFFLFFAFSLYPNFRWLLSKSHNGFWGFLVISTTSQIFLIYTFLTTKRRSFYYFYDICTDMHFFSLFFLNERKNKNSLLMMYLKCTIVHYANLNSSSKHKSFLSYGSLNMLFLFSRFLIYVYFNEAFVKKFMKQLSFFNINFQNSFKM